MKYLFFLAFLFSCGHTPLPTLVTSENPIYVDSEVVPFLERFDAYASNLGIKPNYSNLTVYRTDENPSGNQLAICTTSSAGLKEITIYNSFWDSASDVAKEIVSFHELLHCTLRQAHRDNSVMQAHMLPEGMYLHYYSYYVKEMFNQVDSSTVFVYEPYLTN